MAPPLAPPTKIISSYASALDEVLIFAEETRACNYVESETTRHVVSILQT